MKETAIVTGGLGILGWEFSKALHEAGYDVVIIDTSAKTTISTSIRVYKADITNRNQLQSIANQVNNLTVLVNCAAIDVPPKDKQNALLDTEQDEEEYDKIMEVNVKGTILCSQIFGKEMKKGSIINISSIYGEVSPDQRIYKHGFKKPIAYCASKACIPQITRYLATYFAPKVRVNCLTFGGVYNGQPIDFEKKYSSKVPMGRMARRNEYVSAVLFLASQDSSYMTGSNVVIDGGYLSW